MLECSISSSRPPIGERRGHPREQIRQDLRRKLLGDVVEPFSVAAGVYQGRGQLPRRARRRVARGRRRCASSQSLRPGNRSVAAARLAPRVRFSIAGMAARCRRRTDVRVQARGRLAEGLERLAQAGHGARCAAAAGLLSSCARPAESLPRAAIFSFWSCSLVKSRTRSVSTPTRRWPQHGDALQHLRERFGGRRSPRVPR